MSRSLAVALRLAVWQRAGGRCEYCLLHEEDALLPHEPDHIIGVQHGGPPSLDNLALACFDCNRLKGPNLSSIDPETGEPVALFHPRREIWASHFRLEGARIMPLTPAGRATAALLRFNSRARLADRETLLKAGRHAG